MRLTIIIVYCPVYELEDDQTSKQEYCSRWQKYDESTQMKIARPVNSKEYNTVFDDPDKRYVNPGQVQQNVKLTQNQAYASTINTLPQGSSKSHQSDLSLSHFAIPTVSYLSAAKGLGSGHQQDAGALRSHTYVNANKNNVAATSVNRGTLYGKYEDDDYV